ncbi:MAG: hypothetical protein RL189_433 [Pseudomonadota bacterium]
MSSVPYRLPKGRILRTVALATVCFLAQKAQAEVPIPPLSSPVIDQADLFASSDEQTLSQSVRALFDGGGPQLQVWTLPELEGEPIESVTIRAADQWKLGRSGKDDGLILLIARQERRFRLDVGRGLEGALPDVSAGRLLRSQLAPALRRGEPAAGVHAVIREVARLSSVDSSLLPQNSVIERKPVNFVVFFFFLIVALILSALGKVQGGGHGRWAGRRGGWYGGGGGWSGGGSGGGWSGGGGGFSGGGAGGDW